MSIITKIGDQGETCLYRGKKVAKDHPRIEACGTLDELSVCLGLAKSLIKSRKLKKIIEPIQRELLIIGAELATGRRYLSQLKQRIGEKSIRRLEDIIRQLEAKALTFRFSFVLPGKNLTSSSLDLARVLARRLERRVVSLKKVGMLKNNALLIYLNRLSDLLFLLARQAENKSGRKK